MNDTDHDWHCGILDHWMPDDYSDPTLEPYNPDGKYWYGEEATPRQLNELARLGWKLPHLVYKGEASYLIFNRSKLPTPYEARFLCERDINHFIHWKRSLIRGIIDDCLEWMSEEDEARYRKELHYPRQQR